MKSHAQVPSALTIETFQFSMASYFPLWLAFMKQLVAAMHFHFVCFMFVFIYFYFIFLVACPMSTC